MLLGTIDVSLLVYLLTGKAVIKTGKGIIRSDKRTTIVGQNF